MTNFTSNTYQIKREILTFSNKISKHFNKLERKFIADMNFGILTSGSCLLTDIIDHLHEPSKKSISLTLSPSTWLKELLKMRLRLIWRKLKNGVQAIQLSILMPAML